jgi:hypothetical protein
MSAALDAADLPLETLPSKDLLLKASEGPKDGYRQRHAREMLKLLEAGKLPASVDLPVQVWTFGGGFRMVALGGETCVGYALRIKEELGKERTWVLGYANEVPGYIPTEQVLSEGGYEPGWDLTHGRALAAGSMMFYGWPTPFAPGIEERLMKVVRRLAR